MGPNTYSQGIWKTTSRVYMYLYIYICVYGDCFISQGHWQILAGSHHEPTKMDTNKNVSQGF